MATSFAPHIKHTIKHKCCEEGFILIMALMFLVILSLMAVTSVRLTGIEFKIAGNERVARVNFFNADLASLEGVQQILNRRTAEELIPASDNFDQTLTEPLVDAVDDDDDLANLDRDGDGTPLEDEDLVATALDHDDIVEGKLSQLIVLNQNAPGESLGVSDVGKYAFTSYGYSVQENGSALVRISFKKEIFRFSDD